MPNNVRTDPETLETYALPMTAAEARRAETDGTPFVDVPSGKRIYRVSPDVYARRRETADRRKKARKTANKSRRRNRQ